jgi:hypothetical protein
MARPKGSKNKSTEEIEKVNPRIVKFILQTWQFSNDKGTVQCYTLPENADLMPYIVSSMETTRGKAKLIISKEIEIVRKIGFENKDEENKDD